MLQITMQIDGMQCGMCEAHINDAIRRDFPVKKVTSSYRKGQTIILVQDDIEEQKLKQTIGQTGYEVISITKEPYEKKGFFSAFRK